MSVWALITVLADIPDPDSGGGGSSSSPVLIIAGVVVLLAAAIGVWLLVRRSRRAT